MIYPVPEPGGLGVHLTLNLQGRARFGPDVEWLSAVDDGAQACNGRAFDYAVDPSRADGFYGSIRKYFPALRDGDLSPDYSGVRPKLPNAPDGSPADFYIERMPLAAGWINLCGMESPGITSSFAIASRVSEMLAEDGSLA